MILACFIGFAALILHSILLYPLLLGLLAVIFGRKSRADEGCTPSVSVVIPAYNEEAVIARKLDNTLALDYPPGKVEILVTSESDDGTDAIVGEYVRLGVSLDSSPVRRGKVANVNRVIPRAGGDILVLTDANAMLRSDALRKLARHFADARIGSVSGRLTYENPGGGGAGASEGLYWGLEQWIKRASSRLFSLPGANGSLFAVRRSCYRPISEERGDDFEIPIRCILDGYGSILEPEAVSVEEAVVGFEQEYRRKVRIVSWMLRSAVILLREALSRRRWLLAFQLLSHKINRWALPLWLIGLFITSLLLMERGEAFRAVAAGQAVFYAISLVFLAADRAGLRLRGLLGVPAYFLVVSAASIVGIYSCLAGKDVTWHKTR